MSGEEFSKRWQSEYLKKAVNWGHRPSSLAEYFYTLKSNSLYTESSDLLERLRNLKKNSVGDGWIVFNKPEFPPIGAGETSEVQPFVTKTLKLINEKTDSAGNIMIYPQSKGARAFKPQGSKSIVLQSIPDPEAYRTESYHTRKPDVIAHVRGLTGSLALVWVGDVKGRGSSDFAADQIGHILDLGRDLLVHGQPYRQHVLCFLTDSVRFQFFQVCRDGDEFVYKHTQVLDDGIEGWQIILALLAENPRSDIFGYNTPTLPENEGVKLSVALGRGAAAHVFQGEYQNDKVVVKIFSQKQARDTEKTVLEKLTKCGDLVPQVKKSFNTNDRFVLVVSPVGTPILPVPGGTRITGKELGQLVDVVKSVHDERLVHRDIKPENLYIGNDGLMLSDHSSSTNMGVETEFHGTAGYSEPPNDDRKHKPSIQTDLCAVVRTSYALLCQEPPPTRWEDAKDFWDERIRDGTVWKEAWDAAQAGSYEDLRTVLVKLK